MNLKIFIVNYQFSYAQKNNLPLLEHVTLPRLGAFSAIIDELSPKQTKYGGVTNNNTELSKL